MKQPFLKIGKNEKQNRIVFCRLKLCILFQLSKQFLILLGYRMLINSNSRQSRTEQVLNRSMVVSHDIFLEVKENVIETRRKLKMNNTCAPRETTYCGSHQNNQIVTCLQFDG